MRVTVKFDRIGSDTNPAPLHVEVSNDDAGGERLVKLIWAHVRRHPGSKGARGPIRVLVPQTPKDGRVRGARGTVTIPGLPSGAFQVR